MTRSEEIIAQAMTLVFALDAEHRHVSATIVRELVLEYQISVKHALAAEDVIHRMMKGKA